LVHSLVVCSAGVLLLQGPIAGGHASAAMLYGVIDLAQVGTTDARVRLKRLCPQHNN
jgi:hypothetical protein